MNKNLQNIDELFKTQVDEYTLTPDKNVWEGINEVLDQETFAKSKNKRKLAKYTLLFTVLLFALQIKHVPIPFQNQQTALASTSKTESISPTSKKQEIFTVITKSTKDESALKIETEEHQHNKKTYTSASANNESVKQSRSKHANSITSQASSEANESTIEKNDTKQNDYALFKSKHPQKRNHKQYNTSGIENEDVDFMNSLKTNNTFVEKQLISNVPSIFLQNKLTFANTIIAPKTTPSFALKTMPKIKVFQSVFSITAFVAPEIAFDNLHDDKVRGGGGPGGNQPREDHNKLKNEEQETISLQCGLLFNYTFQSRFQISTGIAYTAFRSEVAPKKVFADVDADGKIKYRYHCVAGSGFIYPKTGFTPNVGDSTNTIGGSNDISYLQIPISISYPIKNGKFEISPQVAVGFNFLMNQKIEAGIVDGSSTLKQTIQKLDGLKANFINGRLGVDLGYSINTKWSVHVMPYTQFAITSINEGTNVQSYPSTVGMLTGIRLHF
jgi:hypothetical protein